MSTSFIKALMVLAITVNSINSYAQESLENITETVTFLSDDRLEGRATGSKGEEIAANYIATKYASIGLQPAGENKGYYQVFEFTAGKEAGPANYIEIPNSELMKTQPLAISGNGKAVNTCVDVGFGIVAEELEYDDYSDKDVKGKIALIKLSTPEGTHPHTDFYNYADERAKVATAVERGATAVVFYNTDENYPVDVLLDYSARTSAVEIPVVLIQVKQAEKLKDAGEVRMEAELNPIKKTGKNIAGIIDNNAECTVIFGAHYDHLGYGESGGSLYRGEPAIHNGADDNASGVALIVELAAKLKKSGNTGYNYMFVAFSGEELGLYGSKSAADKLLNEDACYNYMLNFDMVGRLDDSNSLVVNGYGTSPAWEKIESFASAMNFNITTFESGIGPSDHTSFYLKDIPVLHLFTGSHSDYHKPGDDAEKVNMQGILDIMLLTQALVADLDDEPKITFTKTKEKTNENAPRFTVTLGVIPDYTFEGKGMRIDGVSDGKPAAAAGIKAGDIVTQLGEFEVADMMSYMKALSKFKAGDATTVTIQREDEEHTMNIQF